MSMKKGGPATVAWALSFARSHMATAEKYLKRRLYRRAEASLRVAALYMAAAAEASEARRERKSRKEAADVG